MTVWLLSVFFQQVSLAIFSIVLQMFSDFQFEATVEGVAIRMNFEYMCSTLSEKATYIFPLMSQFCDGCFIAIIFHGRDEDLRRASSYSKDVKVELC